MAHYDTKKLPLVYAVGDRSGLLGELIYDFKYHSVRALAKSFAELIDEVLPKDLPSDSVVVPLPTATHHIRARGLDHTHQIAKNLAKIRGFSEKRVLLRNKNTVQVGANRSERINQATMAYILDPRAKIKKDTTYILLDDIWTTGASIKAATKILKNAGAKNIAVALLAYAS